MPPSANAPLAQKLTQCQNCHKTDPKLKSCSGCRRAHYCSSVCQKADWPVHKQRCKYNQDVVARIQNEDATAGHRSAGSLSLKDSAAILKKWAQLYRPTLSVALVNALTLQTTPQRCLTHFLTIELSPVPEGLSKNLSAIPRSFTVEDVRVNSFEDALASGTPDSEDMKRICADITEKSTPLIASGGLGIGVVQLCVSSLNLAQITPFGFTESLHDLRVEPNWESSLKQAIEKGILV